MRETYLRNIRYLEQYFGSKRLLSVTDVTKYLGIDRRTAVNKFPFNNGYIFINTLAHELSKGG